MRRHDPRDNPGTVLATVMFGLLVLLVPPRTAPRTAPEPVAAAPAAPAAGAPVAAPLPVQKAVAIAARPVVLTDRPSDGAGRTVSLTFDDGPDPRWTPQVLALLRRHAAVATFCVVGAKVHKYPQLVRDIVDAGMRLCNHTRSHPPDLTVAPALQQRSEIIGAGIDIAAAVDVPVAYFRAPGGHWSPEVLQLAAQHRMQPLGWSVDLRDWEQPGVPAILSTLQQHLHPGAVILMHDGGGNRQQTVEALQVMLPWLVDQGYRFSFPTP
jgi:peptidoglycan/xylan/chitin deacetylase (PgdA/CDA1 family)